MRARKEFHTLVEDITFISLERPRDFKLPNVEILDGMDSKRFVNANVKFKT
jgi:hypothetical protein